VIPGGGEKARQLHLSRKKMLPRDRVNNLLDPGFVNFCLEELILNMTSGLLLLLLLFTFVNLLEKSA